MINSARIASFRKKQKWPGAIPPQEMARAGFVFSPDTNNCDNCQCFFCGVDVSGWHPDDDPVEEHLACNPDCAWARVIGLKDNSDEDRLATFTNWPHVQRNFRPSPLALAQAGFYFNPSSAGDDTVECAFCQACLNRWEAQDSPLDEHRSTSPNCDHVLRCFETSSLVESSLGVIPVLEPGAPSPLIPNETYDQSIYGKVLEAPENTQLMPDSSVYETAQSPGSQSTTPRVSATHTDASQASDNTLGVTENGYDSLSRDSSEFNDKSNASIDSKVDEDTNGSMNKSTESLDATPNASAASNELKVDNTPVAEVQGNVVVDKSTTSSKADVTAADVSIDQAVSDTTTNENDYSMVTVAVEEVSVESSIENQGNLEDPETPSVTPRPSIAADPPNLSVLKTAFTSTPFARLSPTKMMSSKAMPSPLSGMPIDLGRPSFGNENSHNQSAQVPMYPRLPSFPSMHGTSIQPEIEQGKMRFNESEPFNISEKPESDTQTSIKVPEESVYHSAIDENFGQDHSTPSPIRSLGGSPSRSFIIGSSPVKNSFDQLIEDLHTPRNSLDMAMPDSSMASVNNTTTVDISQKLDDLSEDAVIVQPRESVSSEFAANELLSLEITKPTKKQILDAFTNYLPRQSIDFLMEAKGQTVREWQLLLADEVERQIQKVTEQAIQETESHRQKIIADIKAQYGR